MCKFKRFCLQIFHIVLTSWYYLGLQHLVDITDKVDNMNLSKLDRKFKV